MGTIKNDTPEFPAKSSETWFIRGKPYIVEGSGYAYFETNGNPDTKYVTMHGIDGTPYVITEKAFVDKAVREEPLVDRVVRPDQIMRANPCEDGARLLFKLIGVPFTGNSYVDAVTVAESGKRTKAYNTQHLYNKCVYDLGGNVPNSYLLFVAKVLNLVPQNSTGPDRGTLLRLLGIKE